MFYSRKISFHPAGGSLYRRAIIDVSLERQHATVRVFRDETRLIALQPTNPLTMAVRSEPYKADPIPAVEAIVQACLGDLEDGLFVETRRNGQTKWTQTFDTAKVARWAGWTNRARRVVNAGIASLQSRTIR